jgi:hypothetical protein
VLGLGFVRVYGATADDECIAETLPPQHLKWQERLADFNRWLHCNMTVDVSRAVEVARRVATAELERPP